MAAVNQLLLRAPAGLNRASGGLAEEENFTFARRAEKLCSCRSPAAGAFTGAESVATLQLIFRRRQTSSYSVARRARHRASGNELT